MAKEKDLDEETMVRFFNKVVMGTEWGLWAITGVMDGIVFQEVIRASPENSRQWTHAVRSKIFEL